MFESAINLPGILEYSIPLQVNNLLGSSNIDNSTIEIKLKFFHFSQVQPKICD